MFSYNWVTDWTVWSQHELEIIPNYDSKWYVNLNISKHSKDFFPVYDYLRHRYGSWVKAKMADSDMVINIIVPESYIYEVFHVTKKYLQEELNLSIIC